MREWLKRRALRLERVLLRVQNWKREEAGPLAIEIEELKNNQIQLRE